MKFSNVKDSMKMTFHLWDEDIGRDDDIGHGELSLS